MSTDEPNPPLPSSWQADESEAVAAADKSSKRFWIVVALAAVGLVALTAVIITKMGDGPETRAWPKRLENRPGGLGDGATTEGAVPTAPQGVYLWNDLGGWHLWVVNGDDLQDLQGTITSSDKIVSAQVSSPSDGKVSTDGKTATFDLKGAAPVEGIEFDPGFSHHLDIDLETADGPVPAKLIFLGAEAKHPSDVPLSIDKPVVDPDS